MSKRAIAVILCISIAITPTMSYASKVPAKQTTKQVQTAKYWAKLKADIRKDIESYRINSKIFQIYLDFSGDLDVYDSEYWDISLDIAYMDKMAEVLKSDLSKNKTSRMAQDYKESRRLMEDILDTYAGSYIEDWIGENVSEDLEYINPEVEVVEQEELSPEETPSEVPYFGKGAYDHIEDVELRTQLENGDFSYFTDQDIRTQMEEEYAVWKASQATN